MNILIESSGGLTSNYLIRSIQELGYRSVCSDISKENHAYSLCDDFIIFPKYDDKDLWLKIDLLLADYNINIVIPSFDETLLGWSQRIDYYKNKNINVILSSFETIKVFQDKWLSYNFFKDIGINTPKTSLENKYNIIKPRFGRGGKGIVENISNITDMGGMISQEKIYGNEYTVDAFFSNDGEPLYIVPRLRLNVVDGKSVYGVVVKNDNICKLVTKISKNISFSGPINFQLFETPQKELVFIEINPRIAGGMALGFAASENWIDLIVKNIVNQENIKTKPIKYGLKMFRYYDEVFI